jgi:hypothetical protein
MKNIFAVILSFVFLITSMGFTVSSHICGGKKVKTVWGIGAADVSCGMEATQNNCIAGAQMNSNCCQDEYQKIQIEEDYNQQLVKEIFLSDFNLVFVATLNKSIPTTTVPTLFFKDYSPPPLVRNIPVLVKSFLI